MKITKVVVAIAMMLPGAAAAYTHVALSVEELAGLSTCVVDGVVQSAVAREAGNAIMTDFGVSISRSAGNCNHVSGVVTVTVYGGELPDGRSASIAGVEKPVLGGRYLFLLEDDQAARELRPVEGPQGQISLASDGSDRVLAEDATGQPLAQLLRGANASGAESFAKEARVPSHLHAGTVQKAANANFTHQIDANALFEYVARAATGITRADKRILQRTIVERLHKGKTNDNINAYRGDALHQPQGRNEEFSRAGTQERRVDCVKPPVPGANARCDLSKYRISGAGGLPWNLPPILTEDSPAATSIMSEWNKYAEHFRLYTEPVNTYGVNGRNDFGGYPQSADLQRIYGYSWGATTLGVTLQRIEYCTEITNEYFLGILVNSYCSRRANESDVFLNPAYTFSRNDLAVRTGASTAYSFYGVLAHELGHGFGLGHSSEMALMVPCDTRKGWQMWPDDAAGARAMWPSVARYGENVGVRLVSVGSTIASCGQPAVSMPSSNRTSVFYSPSTSSVSIGSFLVANMNNAAHADTTVEWYLTTTMGSFAAGTYEYLGSTVLGTVQPGLTAATGGQFPVPATVSGTRYLAAFLRNSGNSGTASDWLGTPLAIMSPGLLRFKKSLTWVPEAQGAVVLDVERIQGTSGAVSIGYSTFDATGVAGVNYAASNGTLSWLNGDSAPKTITVPIIHDQNSAGQKLFSVRLATPGGAGIATPYEHLVTIVDDVADVFPANCAIPTTGWANAPAGASAGWNIATDTLTEGRCSMKSAPIPDATAGVSKAEVSFTGVFTAGRVTFDRRVSSESYYDCFTFLIDNVPQAGQVNDGEEPAASCMTGAASGELEWARQSATIAAGQHTLTWRYEKDGSIGTGSDAAWIDNLAMPLAVPDPTSTDLVISHSAAPATAGTGKDIVFTLNVSNAGPVSASTVTVTNSIPSGSSLIWASSGCEQAAGSVTCNLGALGRGASREIKVVVRALAAGSLTNTATVAAPAPDLDPANNTTSANTLVSASPAANAVLRYRLYSPVTLEHHFTTDSNEYNVLGGNGNWIQEGTVGKVLDNPGMFNGVAAVPYYRLYDNGTQWHHWTSDANEYYTLAQFSGWNAEGVDGYILPAAAMGTTQLFRLNYPFLGSLHHWTIDANEYNVLTTSYGWVGEGGAGFVIR